MVLFDRLFETMDERHYLEYKDGLVKIARSYSNQARDERNRMIKYKNFCMHNNQPTDFETMDFYKLKIKLLKRSCTVTENQIARTSKFICQFRQYKRGKTNYTLDDMKRLFVLSVLGV